ncbi:MAG: primosomal protein N', partial [Ruminococcus sp.]|nr:primosomal protein N' [Ruminococcus sp.]
MRGIMTVAKVAINRAAYSFDCEYSYIVPPELKEHLTIGARVLVPFGRGNRKSIGFVTRIYEDTHFNENLKPMISIIDTPSLLNDEMLKIIFWLKDNTFCTYFDAFKTVVPTGFSYNITQHYALANKSIDSEELTEQEKNALEYLKGVQNKREVDKFLDTTISVKRKKLVESLIDKGFLEEVNVLKRKIGDKTEKMVRLS